MRASRKIRDLGNIWLSTVQVSKAKTDGSRDTWVRVGYYDMAEKAAILIFPDKNCELMPKRFYWDPEDDNGSQYNEADLT